MRRKRSAFNVHCLIYKLKNIIKVMIRFCNMKNNAEHENIRMCTQDCFQLYKIDAKIGAGVVKKFFKKSRDEHLIFKFKNFFEKL